MMTSFLIWTTVQIKQGKEVLKMARVYCQKCGYSMTGRNGDYKFCPQCNSYCYFYSKIRQNFNRSEKISKCSH